VSFTCGRSLTSLTLRGVVAIGFQSCVLDQISTNQCLPLGSTPAARSSLDVSFTSGPPCIPFRVSELGVPARAMQG
jgi:hypothetical protein